MKVLTLLGAMLMCASVQAQTVYRCGPDGRVYSQIPCPQGRVVEVGYERSPEQRVTAEVRVRDDQVRAGALERERLDRESMPPATAGKIEGRPTAAVPDASAPKSSKKKKAKNAASGDFVAIAPTKKPKSR